MSTAPTIHIERKPYRSSIAVLGQSATSYALLELAPAGAALGPAPALNLALLVDVSGSMYEEDGTSVTRLKRVQDAALAAVRKLRPDDTLSVVAFGRDAQVVLPATPLTEAARVEDVIGRIDRFDVDPGGTAIDQALALGLAEVTKNAGPGRMSKVLLLTDGTTSAPDACRRVAREAAEKKVAVTAMGVGTDWNSAFIKELTGLGNGRWYYIDVNEAGAADRAFAEEFGLLAAAGFLDAELHLHPLKDVKVKRVRMVFPQIRELPTEETDGHLVCRLGTLDRERPTRYLLELSLPARPDGKFKVVDVETTFDLGTGRRETTGRLPLEMIYSAAGQGFINAEVARHIDDVQMFEANKILQNAIATENQEEAVRAARIIEKKAEVMGFRAAKKTMLAKQVLSEINEGGRVSKKTQLAVDDAARMTDEEEYEEEEYEEEEESLAPVPAPAPAPSAADPGSLLDVVLSASRAAPPSPPATPPPIDQIHFSVTSAGSMLPGHAYVLDVWAHLEGQRQEVLERAREALGGAEPRIRSKAGVPLARGTLIQVQFTLPGFEVEEPEDFLCWEGAVGNATFLVRVPADLRPGEHPGTVHFYVAGVKIARLHFMAEVGERERPGAALRSREQHLRRAFASYATADRDAVLGRVQGLQKALPALDVFLDVASLRSGQLWQDRLREEVTGRDVFYLFWSAQARQSQWVEWEWRTALAARGIGYIDPVPLVPPDEAPPPQELAAHLHFNDWVLAYRRGVAPAGHAVAAV